MTLIWTKSESACKLIATQKEHSNCIDMMLWHYIQKDKKDLVNKNPQLLVFYLWDYYLGCLFNVYLGKSHTL